MIKTYDGRRIGNTYRFIPPEEKDWLKKLRAGVIAVVGIASALALSGYVLLLLPLLVLTTFLLVASSVMYALSDAPSTANGESTDRLFSKYTIISESMDDHGRVKTLIEWHKSKQQEWISFH